MSIADQPAPPRANRSRRRNAAIVAAIILGLLVLAITPPLINVSRYRLRIASSISQSIGRPVHLDEVTLHLLPTPGFALKNLVVSEDPAFGSEPVIRASEVDASIRVSSLWRRQVEFSTIRFVEVDGNHPSLNIVRNAQGRWNLQDILLQAARVNTAPTAQRKAGAAPRFPYIEATGARINIKLGDEKMPFSLTDADFALWLPSPEAWHVRLKGKPARTDTNATDTGDVRLEGTLGRATRLPDVPLNLTASWANAQMGEASLLFTGNDAGWRGQVEAGATLNGLLANAGLTADIHLTDLRRDDFVPTKLLDVSSHCAANANLTSVSLTMLSCTIPDGAADPVLLSVPTVDLQRPTAGTATLALNHMPLNWALDWARVLNQNIPASTLPVGFLDGDLRWDSPPTRSEPPIPGTVTDWEGDLHFKLTSATVNETLYDFSKAPIENDLKAGVVRSTSIAGHEDTLIGVATTLPGTTTPVFLQLNLFGELPTISVATKATSSQITAIGNAILPTLGDRAAKLLPSTQVTTPVSLNLQCPLSPNADHPCTNSTPPPPPTTKPKPHRRQ